jgi:phenylacetate-CoA ligase
MTARGTPRPLLSSSQDLLWPAAPSPAAAQLLSLLYQLDQSQWWPADALAQAQLVQLARLFAHARDKCALYRERFEASSVDPGPLRPGDLQSLPLLTRRELLTRAAELHATELPSEHGSENQVTTSGSTGQIVALRRTSVSRGYLFALGLRAHAWHETDFRQTLAVIRADSVLMDDEARAAELGWGQPATLLYRTGPAFSLPISTDVSEQAEWLARRKPGYLLTYATNLAALLDCCEQRGLTISGLRGVRSMGETLSPETRARCRAIWKAPVVDVYSAQEVGVIAIECPESGLYHVQSESLVVEVLDDQDRACEPGQEGRVIVTDLHNFAMPLLRYDIGDRAVVGPACSCGRGLPTLLRVLGRERHMVVLPGGARHWPLVGLHEYRRVAPILQYQLVQETLDLVELRLVTAPLSPEQERALTAIVQRALAHPFQVRFRYYDAVIPRAPGGKFEEFVSLVR